MGANEPGPDAENADPKARGTEGERRAGRRRGAGDRRPRRRHGNEPGPDAENADPKAREARRENDGPDAGEEPEIEGHRKLQ